MPITVLKNNVPWGPFSRDQVKASLDRGDFTLQSLAHVPGLKQWLPLGEVLNHYDKAASIPPASRPSSPPADLASLPPVPTGRPLAPPITHAQPPPVPATPVAATGKPEPIVPPKIERPPVPEPTAAKPHAEPPPLVGPLESAPFFPRFIAFALDCGILFVPILLLIGVKALSIEIYGLTDKHDTEDVHQEWLNLLKNFQQLILLVAIGAGWLYASLLECSRWEATVGKQWMRLRVADRNGQRLTFFHATGRHFAKVLSALPIFLGFTAALFSKEGLAWHDRLAKTRVLKK